MKKRVMFVFLVLTLALFVFSASGVSFATDVPTVPSTPDSGTELSNGPTGPAPNSGDSLPDGSGIDHSDVNVSGPGPAPNAGDGVSDGPGW